MLSIQIKDNTWSAAKLTLSPDDGSLRNGFMGLKFGYSDKGCATLSFVIPETALLETAELQQFDAVDLWAHREKIWQGRIKRPLQQNTDGLLEVECEGMAAAWGRSTISTWDHTGAPSPASTYYSWYLSVVAINLMNSDSSFIESTSFNLGFNFQETTMEEVLNQVANYGFDTSTTVAAPGGAAGSVLLPVASTADMEPGGTIIISTATKQAKTIKEISGSTLVLNETLDATTAAGTVINTFHVGEWGFLPLKNAAYISDMGNRLYWRKVNMSVVDAVIPYEALESCEIAVDTQEYANAVRARHGSGYVDITVPASQAKYTPGKAHWKALSLQSSSGAADAWQIGGVYILRHARPWPKGSVVLGERFWRDYGFQIPAFQIRAGMNIRIPGLTQARPDLIGAVTDETVYRIVGSEYEADPSLNTLTLNDYPDNAAIWMAREQARTA